jgi:uncharacterized protein YlxP (DUF503 family)
MMKKDYESLFLEVKGRLNRSFQSGGFMPDNGGDPRNNPNSPTNPNANAKGRFLENFSTRQVTPFAVVDYQGSQLKGEIKQQLPEEWVQTDRRGPDGQIILERSEYVNQGVVTDADLKNNTSVEFKGTIEEHEAMLRKLNRANFLGSHGFRGKGWDTGMTEEEKKAFKEDNKFFELGRERNVAYDLTGDPYKKVYYTNDRTGQYASFEDGGGYYDKVGQALRDTFKSSLSKFEDGGEQDVTKLLAGELMTGIDPSAKLPPNAELEDKEYLKFPDGTTQKIAGDSHKDGGTEVHIPDGTKILSQKRTLTKAQVKDIKATYDIDVTEKDSYSQVVDKYVKKIGLRKLYDDQEQVFKELDKVIKDPQSEGSARVNKEYLSKKIYQIEKQKEEKETLKEKIFNTLYTMQEVAKEPEEKQNAEQFFEQGGISRDAFKSVVQRLGLTEQEGIDLYQGKKIGKQNPMFEDGGPKGGIPRTLEEVQQMYKEGKITQEEANMYESGQLPLAPPAVLFTTTANAHQFSDKGVYTREEQHAGDAAFGKITKESLPTVLNNLYRNFPDIVAEEYGVVYNDDGTIEFDQSLDFKTMSDKVMNFQKRANKRMEETADFVISNPDSFSPEYVKSAEDYKKNETFDESLARGVDSKLGNFTSGRFSLGIDIVTPEEKKDLESKGIFTTKQLQTAIDDGSVKLSDPSLNRLEQIRSMSPPDADIDFSINTYTTTPSAPPKDKEVPKPEDPFKFGDPIIDNIEVPDKKYPRLFNSPDMSPIPPSGLDAHLLGDIRLQRIDPIRIGVETQLQQTNDAIKQGTEAFDYLPPSQRTAAIVALQTNAQKAVNEAIHSTNITNAQNQSSAELFNIGQAGQESQARMNNLLSFEQRQLTAKAKTEEEVRNYYDQLNRIRLNNYRNQQDIALIQSMSPDYSLSANGMGIDFTPDGKFKTVDNSKYKGIFG